MDYFYRLILRRIAYVLVALLFGFLTTYCSKANSAIYINSLLNGYQDISFPTVKLWCDHAHQLYVNFLSDPSRSNFASTCSPTGLQVGFYSINMTWTITGGSQGSQLYSNKGQGVSTACTPPQDYNNTNQTCVEPVTCELKTIAPTTYAFPATSDPNNVKNTDYPYSNCIGGCTVVSSGSFQVTDLTNGSRVITVGNYQTGGKCTAGSGTATDQTSITATEKDCIAKGESFISFNGLSSCVPLKEAIAPVGATNSTITTNADGSKSTTTTTNNIDNTKITTTTTVTAPNGTKTTTTKETDKASFCESNPNNIACKKEDKESNFGGACSGGFTCEGDAVQCAIAKEQHTKNCELFTKETELTTQGKAMQNNETDNPAKESNRQVVNVSTMVTEGNNIGSGTFQDKVIPFKGAGITLPFSQLNFIVQLLGGFLLAGAYINAARIVGVR